MASERYLLKVGPVSFTVDGGIDGKITLASTDGFKVKQKVLLAGTALTALELEVKRVESTTVLYVGPQGGDIGTRQDISLFTVAASATITAREQSRPRIPLQEINRAVYEEEPTVAIRVVSVDKNGNVTSGSGTTGDVNLVGINGTAPSVTNPLPVRLTDGSVNIGTVNANIEVQLDHAGTPPDSVRIGDGTTTAIVTPAGALVVSTVPGSIADTSTDEAGDGLTALGAGVTLMTELTVAAGTTYYLTGWSWASDRSCQFNLEVIDGVTVVRVIRIALNSGANPTGWMGFFSPIEITGAATRKLRVTATRSNGNGGSASAAFNGNVL